MMTSRFFVYLQDAGGSDGGVEVERDRFPGGEYDGELWVHLGEPWGLRGPDRPHTR